MPKNPLSNHFQVVLSVVMVALTIGLTLVEAWGQSGPSKIIIAPTDQYYPKPYWSVRNWDNRLGFDPIFEGKVAFYKEKGLPIEWDPEVGNFVVVGYSGDAYRLQKTGCTPDRWKMMHPKVRGLDSFPRCAWFSWWSTFQPYRGSTASHGGRISTVTMPINDVLSYYSRHWWGGNKVFAIADPHTLPMHVSGPDSTHEYNGIIISSHAPARLRNPEAWAKYIAQIPADLTKIHFPPADDERYIPGITSQAEAYRVAALSPDFEEYINSVRETAPPHRPYALARRRSAPSVSSDALSQRSRLTYAIRQNRGYAVRAGTVTVGSVVVSLATNELLKNNPEAQASLAACEQMKIDARDDFWRPREQNETWLDYQLRKLLAVLAQNAEAVGTTAF